LIGITFNRISVNAKVENGIKEGTFRTIYKLSKQPKVSIIIPTKDKIDYLQRCIQSIINKSTYQNYEIILVDSKSVQKESFDYYKELSSNPKIKIIDWNLEFNFSKVNNFAVEKSLGEFLLFLNNDTEIISADWIESMLQLSQRKDIGAVGCKLLYPNNTIQHAGVFLGVGGIANHNFYRFPNASSQPFPLLNSKDIIRNFSAVTAACLMVEKSKFLKVKGFNPDFKIAYNDIDLCLRLGKSDFKTVYTPYAILYHYESTTISANRDLLSTE
jgi:GT2 family glycosyltransferase